MRSSAVEQGGREKKIRELVSWALPIQEHHFKDALKQCSLKLTAEEGPG